MVLLVASAAALSSCGIQNLHATALNLALDRVTSSSALAVAAAAFTSALGAAGVAVVVMSGRSCAPVTAAGDAVGEFPHAHVRVLSRWGVASRRRVRLHGDFLLVSLPQGGAETPSSIADEPVDALLSLAGAHVSLDSCTLVLERSHAPEAKLRLQFQSSIIAGRWFVMLQQVADRPSFPEKIDMVAAEMLAYGAPLADGGAKSKPELGGKPEATAVQCYAERGRYHVDYAEEGRKLMAAVNLGSHGAASRHSSCDPIWRHPESGAVLYVGDEIAAKNREALRKWNIQRVVNCQDSDGDNYFEGDSSLKYYRFTIGLWRRAPKVLDGGEGTWSYWGPYFAFVEDALSSGQNVFVHCLAGAHRAGTAGIAALMFYCGWDWRRATAAAQKLRRAIEPIGDFPELLEALDRRLCAAQAMRSPSAVGPGPGEPASDVERARQALQDYAGQADAKQDIINAAYAHIVAGKPGLAMQAVHPALHRAGA